MQDGRLTKVTILQQPSGNSRDAAINDYALPILINELSTAQSANIDMVSGATVTSDGYVNRCRPRSTRLPVAKAQSAPLQVKITVQGRNHPLQPPNIDIVSPTTMTSRGHVQSLQPARRGWQMSNTAAQERTDRGIHRRVEHIIGMPINLAMRSRHTATAESHQTWQEVINQKIRPALGSSSPSPFYWPLQPEVWCSPQGSRSGGGHPRHHLCTRRPPAPAPWYGFSEAAVVTIGGLGGALVAWRYR